MWGGGAGTDSVVLEAPVDGKLYGRKDKTWEEISLEQKDTVGTILYWPSSILPENYLWVNGDNISISEYPELYSVLGTDYDDDTTEGGKFKLPTFDPIDSGGTAKFVSEDPDGGRFVFDSKTGDLYLNVKTDDKNRERTLRKRTYATGKWEEFVISNSIASGTVYAINSNKKLLYIASNYNNNSSGSHSIDIIDLNTMELIKELQSPVEGAPYFVSPVFNPITEELYVGLVNTRGSVFQYKTINSNCEWSDSFIDINDRPSFIKVNPHNGDLWIVSTNSANGYKVYVYNSGDPNSKELVNMSGEKLKNNGSSITFHQLTNDIYFWKSSVSGKTTGHFFSFNKDSGEKQLSSTYQTTPRDNICLNPFTNKLYFDNMLRGSGIATGALCLDIVTGEMTELAGNKSLSYIQLNPVDGSLWGDLNTKGLVQYRKPNPFSPIIRAR